MLTIILSLIIAYLLGSISSGVIVSRCMGLTDPRTAGSKNLGATNVLRLGSKPAAALTLLGDMLKGFLSVYLASLFNLSPLVLGFIGFAALIGHAFPVFSHFKGGKGVATALGVVLAITWPLGLAVIATWLVVAILFRYSSLAAIIAVLLAPLYALFLTSIAYLPALILISLFIIARHHENIHRLWAGIESKIGQK